MATASQKQAKIVKLKESSSSLAEGVTIVRDGEDLYCRSCLALNHLVQVRKKKKGGFYCPRCKKVCFLNTPTVLGTWPGRMLGIPSGG